MQRLPRRWRPRNARPPPFPVWGSTASASPPGWRRVFPASSCTPSPSANTAHRPLLGGPAHALSPETRHAAKDHRPPAPTSHQANPRKLISEEDQRLRIPPADNAGPRLNHDPLFLPSLVRRDCLGSNDGDLARLPSPRL
jgi:hypothetical protein